MSDQNHTSPETWSKDPYWGDWKYSITVIQSLSLYMIPGFKIQTSTLDAYHGHILKLRDIGKVQQLSFFLWQLLSSI